MTTTGMKPERQNYAYYKDYLRAFGAYIRAQRTTKSKGIKTSTLNDSDEERADKISTLMFYFSIIIPGVPMEYVLDCYKTEGNEILRKINWNKVLAVKEGREKGYVPTLSAHDLLPEEYKDTYPKGSDIPGSLDTFI